MSTKQKILDSAMHVLINEGFASMTQTRVAKVAGIGQGLLTYHFPTRNDLLTSVVDESKVKMSETIAQITQEGLTIDMFTDLCCKLSANKSFIGLMLTMTSAAIDDPSLQSWFIETDKKTRQNIIKTLLRCGYKVREDDVHLFRASLIGASTIRIQQNTESSEKIHHMVIKLAVKQLIKNATHIS